MSIGVWRKPKTHRPPPPWQPAPGFVERRPGVWAPDDWEPGPYQLDTPAVLTSDEATVEYDRCSNNLSYFGFRHCYTVHTDDPSGTSPWRKVPYYPHLRRFFHAVQDPCNVHDEKSRQMFMTWAWMVVFLWDINFHARWENLVISRRASEVDDGGERSTANSLLGKIRYIWMSLPPYLQSPMSFMSGVIRNPELGSVVHGETGTAKAGRGSTMRRVLVDEAAYIERSEGVFKSVRQVAKNGTILQSTPNGKGNAFARIRFQKGSTFLKLKFHWSEHPEKARGLYCTCGWRSDPDAAHPPHVQFEQHDCANLKQREPSPPERRSPWYDRECGDLTPEQVGTELDISYDRSVRGHVYEFFQSTRHVRDHTLIVDPRTGRPIGERGEQERPSDYRKRYLRAAIHPHRPCIVGWDFGVADPTSLVLGQVADEDAMAITWLDEYEMTGQSWLHYWEFVMGLWEPLVQSVTGLSLMHYGDPSGKGRQSDLTSWVSNLASREPRIIIVHTPSTGSVLEWLDFVRMLMLQRDTFAITTYAAHTIDALQQYRFPTDPDTGELIPGKQLPVHDQYSHSMSAMRYVYQFRWPGRLNDRDRKAVGASAILAAGEDDRRETPPPAW